LLVALLLLVLVSPPPETIPLMAIPPVVVGVTFNGKLTLPLAGIFGELFVHTSCSASYGPVGAQVQPLPPPLLKVNPVGMLKLSLTLPVLAPEPTLFTVTV
jgi:hypothetical protein